jgi:hypothetical protein
MKYQVVDGGARGWEVVQTRTGKVLKSFKSFDEQQDKTNAMVYAQRLVEDDRWNAANRG